jgi:hypothetical protein
MKRFLLLCSLAAWIVLPVSAQEKTKTEEPKKTQEPKKTTEPKKTDKEPSKEKEPAKTPAKPQLQLEIVNLNNPCGVAVQPLTGDVFISDSGNLRILRYDPNLKPRTRDAIRQEITGFSKDVYGKGPKYDIGPLGLLFLNHNLLMVGDGGHQDGQELIYLFDVGQPRVQQAENAKVKLGPIGPTPGKTEKGEGNFYALAYQEPTAVFFTTNGDDTKGWIAKITLKDNTPDPKIELVIPTKEYTGEVDAPVAITMSPDKKLVIGQMGEVTGKGKDSLLLVYDPLTLKPLMKAETGLYDIAALAYHPKSKKLYALDFAWEAPKEGGLFRLDVSGEGANAKVKAERVTYLYEAGKDDSKLPFAGDAAAMDKPTAMAFDPAGNLYITMIGTAKEGAKEVSKDGAIKPGTSKEGDAKNPGRLVRITGLPNE